MYTPIPYVPSPGLMITTHKEISVYYHPQDAADWAKYLQTKLGEREYQIDTVLNDITSGSIFKNKTRVNVFLISPCFLDQKDMNIVTGFDSHFSLALLMGVDMNDFTCVTKELDVYDHVNEWVKLEVQASEESVRNLLMTIVSMYETDPDTEPPYDVLPPRIPPLNDVINVTQEVTDKGVKIYIGLERQFDSDVYIKFDGEEEQVKATFLKAHFYCFKLTGIVRDGYPHSHSSRLSVGEKAHRFSTFRVMCNNKQVGEGQLEDCATSPQQTKDDFDMNPLKSALVSEPREQTKDRVVTGPSLGALANKQDKLDQLREILEEETDPISLLCQCMELHGSDRGRLDKILADKILASGPPAHLSFAGSPERLSDTCEVSSDQKWPTLLHFAAEYNLMNFAEAILTYPALEGTCFIKNCERHTPDDIVKYAGHLELSERLKLFSLFLLDTGRRSHDSGYRGSDKVPSLSQIKRYSDNSDSSPVSQTSLPPPQPHTSGYVDASGYSRPPKPRPLHVTRASSLMDSGLDKPSDNIIEEEKLEEQAVVQDNPEDTEVFVGERKDSQDIKDSTLRAGGSRRFFGHENPEVDGKRSSVMSKSHSESDSETLRPHSEEISPPFPSLLDIGKTYSEFEKRGTEADEGSHQKEKPMPQKKKEKTGIFNFLTNKRRRAKSEPFIHGGIIYRRPSNNDERACNISTSNSGSSYSETSEHEEEAVTPRAREDTKDKSKTKIKLFLKNAEKRKSMRLCHAMEERNLEYPSLPPKKSTFPDEVI